MMAVPHYCPKPTFMGTVRQIYAMASIRGFYAGLTPCLLRAFPSNACAYYVYEGLMRAFNAEKVNSRIDVVGHPPLTNASRPGTKIEVLTVHPRPESFIMRMLEASNSRRIDCSQESVYTTKISTSLSPNLPIRQSSARLAVAHHHPQV